MAHLRCCGDCFVCSAGARFDTRMEARETDLPICRVAGDGEDERISLLFTTFAIVTVAGAVAAMSFRQLVHSVLALTVAFAGLAAIYLKLGAQFGSAIKTMHIDFKEFLKSSKRGGWLVFVVELKMSLSCFK